MELSPSGVAYLYARGGGNIWETVGSEPLLAVKYRDPDQPPFGVSGLVSKNLTLHSPQTPCFTPVHRGQLEHEWRWALGLSPAQRCSELSPEQRAYWILTRPGAQGSLTVLSAQQPPAWGSSRVTVEQAHVSTPGTFGMPWGHSDVQ